eukprot:m.345334 g.345334  ORF g.345334 m.345334 type:complete len:564 (+) comp20664_c0_seq1:105-1796(+)
MPLKLKRNFSVSRAPRSATESCSNVKPLHKRVRFRPPYPLPTAEANRTHQFSKNVTSPEKKRAVTSRAFAGKQKRQRKGVGLGIFSHFPMPGFFRKRRGERQRKRHVAHATRKQPPPSNTRAPPNGGRASRPLPAIPKELCAHLNLKHTKNPLYASAVSAASECNTLGMQQQPTGEYEYAEIAGARQIYRDAIGEVANRCEPISEAEEYDEVLDGIGEGLHNKENEGQRRKFKTHSKPKRRTWLSKKAAKKNRAAVEKERRALTPLQPSRCAVRSCSPRGYAASADITTAEMEDSPLASSSPSRSARQQSMSALLGLSHPSAPNITVTMHDDAEQRARTADNHVLDSEALDDVSPLRNTCGARKGKRSTRGRRSKTPRDSASVRSRCASNECFLEDMLDMVRQTSRTRKNVFRMGSTRVVISPIPIESTCHEELHPAVRPQLSSGQLSLPNTSYSTDGARGDDSMLSITLSPTESCRSLQTKNKSTMDHCSVLSSSMQSSVGSCSSLDAEVAQLQQQRTRQVRKKTRAMSNRNYRQTTVATAAGKSLAPPPVYVKCPEFVSSP